MPLKLPFYALGLAVAAAWDDSGFFNWFQDELREASGASVIFEGTVPEYLAGGSFVQTGPARFSFGNQTFTHMLDGYSKTNTLQFGAPYSPTGHYSTKFLQSGFMNDSIKTGGIARGMFVGGIEPPPHWGPTAVLGPNDNNYIKMRQVGSDRMILADTMIATVMEDDLVTFDTNLRSKSMGALVPGIPWEDKLEPTGDLCMLGTMAHADEDPVTGVLTGAMGCFGLQGSYHVVFEVHPDAPDVRKAVAKIKLPKGRGASYMHTMAATPNYIVLIAEPLYMEVGEVLKGVPLGEGALLTNEDPTLFQIIDRKTHEVKTVEAPGFIYGHLLNAWEEEEEIVMDLTWYAANNATTLGWFNRWFLKYMKDADTRESWPRSQVHRFRLRADGSGSVKESLLFAEEKGENDFETPKINEAYMGKPYCMAYLLQFHSYEYDQQTFSAPKELVGGPMGAVGIAKRNLCTGEITGWYSPNTYPSEVQFVANPKGTSEDDGVLLGMVYDGNTNSSFFHILDARTLETVAKAPLPIKTPFLIHSSWFPEKAR